MSTTTRPTIRHAVILTHPDARSFNAAVAGAYCDAVRRNGQDYILRDLYRLKFNPILRSHERPDTPKFRLSRDVHNELDTLRGCDLFVFIYPIWFGMPPAMMKGYVDRVIGSGVTAQQIETRRAEGPLSGAHLLCITTSGAREAWLSEQGQREALRELSSRYLFRAFDMKFAETMHIGGIVEGMEKTAVAQHLHAVREKARTICAKLFAERYEMAPLPSIGDGS